MGLPAAEIPSPDTQRKRMWEDSEKKAVDFFRSITEVLSLSDSNVEKLVRLNPRSIQLSKHNPAPAKRASKKRRGENP